MTLGAIDMLMTTRSVRKRLDLTRPVPHDLVLECLEAATQAPTGSNLQGWEFVLVDDPEQKQLIADEYRKTHADYEPLRARHSTDAGVDRMKGSVDFLAENLQDVPLLVIPIQRGRLSNDATVHQEASFYGSIFPATWSFMLAARYHGLGTSFTTMHLKQEAAVAQILGIPIDRVTQIGLIATGFYTGDTFSPAKRRPVSEIVHWNKW